MDLESAPTLGQLVTPVIKAINPWLKVKSLENVTGEGNLVYTVLNQVKKQKSSDPRAVTSWFIAGQV